MDHLRTAVLLGEDLLWIFGSGLNEGGQKDPVAESGMIWILGRGVGGMASFTSRPSSPSCWSISSAFFVTNMARYAPICSADMLG
jgi:hypothetical protein